MTPIEITTPRLHLRPWCEADRAPYAAMNADPEVMAYLPGPASREASDRSIDQWRAELHQRGWSNWAVALREGGTFIGFIGLTVPRRALPFMPCVEVGWRLARACWHRGYATEGARAALQVGFEQLGLDEIVSFTTLANTRSRAVMSRIGLLNAQQDFEHPALPAGSPLRPHCLYRLSRARWRALHTAAAQARLRPATAADALRVAALLIDTRARFMPFAPSAHSDDDVRGWVASTLVPGGGVTVAEIGGEVLGAMATATDGGIGWITQMAVDPVVVGQGLGARLLAHALAMLPRPIRLYTFQANGGARRFYERHGFAPIALTDGQGNEEHCPDVLYELA